MRSVNVDIEKKYARMKPEVYEQLARTFLEKKKNKTNKKPPKTSWIILGSCAVLGLFIVIFLFFMAREKTDFLQKSLYIGLDKSPITIFYNFNDPKADRIKAISFSLGDIDVSRYRFLDFRARLSKKTSTDSAIKVQIENAFKEIAYTYITGVTWQWKRFSLPLSDFKKITDRTTISSIAFIIEDWNLSDKENSVIIDEVKFTK